VVKQCTRIHQYTSGLARSSHRSDVQPWIGFLRRYKEIPWRDEPNGCIQSEPPAPSLEYFDLIRNDFSIEPVLKEKKDKREIALNEKQAKKVFSLAMACQ
jgi:hypothetical protein